MLSSVRRSSPIWKTPALYNRRAIHSRLVAIDYYEAMGHCSMTVIDEYVCEASKKRMAVDIARAITEHEANATP